MDLDPASPETQSSEFKMSLLEAVQELWINSSVRFGGELLELLENNSDVKLTVMIRSDADDGQSYSASDSLIGFIAYRINNKLGEKKYMCIRRLAISPNFQRQGRASQFMKWCLRQPGVGYLTCTSLARAHAFYRAFGFRKVETWSQGGTAHPDDKPAETQVYMEYHPGAQKGKKNKARK